MKPIEINDEAAAEGRIAAQWYEDVREGLGVDFRLELKRAFAKIRENPRLYPSIRGSFHYFILDRFPYSLIYKELADRIWIAAIKQHKRRSQYWTGRQPE